MSENNTSKSMGGVYNPLWCATETTFHSSKKFYPQMPEIILITQAKNLYLKERSQKSKKFVHFPINPSPINGHILSFVVKIFK